MRITIIQADGLVGVDGVFRAVDLADLDPDILAIQFDTVRGRGHIEFDRGATIEIDVRDELAETAAELAAGEDREKLAALVPIMKKAAVQRPNEALTNFTPYQAYVQRWIDAAPAAPTPPTPEQLQAAAREAKRAAALRALDDARLAEAALDPLAPQEVKDYATALEVLAVSVDRA